MKKITQNQIDAIIAAVAEKDFSRTSCKARPVGCPMQFMAAPELQVLSKYQYHAAFRLGLIGNNGHVGSIIDNVKA